MLHAMLQKYPTLRFLFDRLNKASKTVSATVYIELLFKGKRKYIHTGVKVFKNEWSEKNNVVGRFDALDLNNSLEIQYRSISKWINELQEAKEEFTFDKLERRLTSAKGDSFLVFMEDRIKDKTIEDSTKNQHYVLLRKLQEFGGINNFSDLKTENIISFDDYLRKTLSHQPTIHGYHKKLKTYIYDAMSRKLIKENPYVGFDVAKGSFSRRKYLTPEELASIESVEIADKSISKIRDIFVFQCYTGLSYADLHAFDWNNCFKDGEDYYILDERVKTDTEYYIMMLPKALSVLKKYDYKLPIITNQQYNLRLKVLASYAEITKNLTTHVARHSNYSFRLKKSELQE